ncbi:MAG TPA: hypothetical protein VMS98_00555 [Thermoanaerobaculia bacterium]|nr:hypothetical protein [Thermoanaerobaculia bacterium]
MPLLIVLSLLALPAGESTPRGRLVENVACQSDPSQTYTLFLPPAYSADRRWPLLLIFDSRGRGTFAAEIFREPAEAHGWIILSSNNTRSDGPMEPNQKALEAMWPEANLRYASDPGRIYAAGFSGGAVLSWALAQTTGGIAGVISAGGRRDAGIPVEKIEFAHFGAAGVRDFNHDEMLRLDALMASKKALHRLEIFPGGHSWMPKPLAAAAIRWMEIVAMKRELRARDQRLIDETYAAESARAETLEREGKKLDSARQWEMLVRTFEGLRDVTAASTRSKALRADRETQRAERDEKRWNDWEARTVQRAYAMLNRIGAEEVMVEPALVRSLEIAGLQKRAAQPSYEGGAAQRVLESILVHASFYLPQELFPRARYREAAAVLAVAVAIRDDVRSWYNLGAARARLGRRNDALAALERAIQLGYKDHAHLGSDADYASVRSDPRYQRLLESLPAPP